MRNGQLARTQSANPPVVVSALALRSNLGRLLRRIETENRALIVKKRGSPAAILLNIRDYVRLAAPEPEVLKLIADDARRNRTSALTSRQIDRIIKAARKESRKR